MRHLVPISGKDSLATAIVLRTHWPDQPYEYAYSDTRMELPETYVWLETVEKALGVTIIRMGKSLLDVIYEQGMLPSQQRRFCTKYSKIYPMRDFLNGDESTLYIGLRADEDRAGAKPERNMQVRYPLKELGITLPMVYAILDKQAIAPPSFFWDRMFQTVKAELESLGLGWILETLPRFVFERAFAWRSRPNCFMCFYQRRYEWVGLLEFHPELFERAERLEIDQDYYKDGRPADKYYWIGPDMPLAKIKERAGDIFNNRSRALVKLIASKAQKDLFADSILDELDMAQTSCGMFCGK